MVKYKNNDKKGWCLMRSLGSRLVLIAICGSTILLTSCVYFPNRDTAYTAQQRAELAAYDNGVTKSQK